MSFLEPLLSWFSQRCLNPLLGTGKWVTYSGQSQADISKQTLEKKRKKSVSNLKIEIR